VITCIFKRKIKKKEILEIDYSKLKIRKIRTRISFQMKPLSTENNQKNKFDLSFGFLIMSKII
jgi:hypothetical protein